MDLKEIVKQAKAAAAAAPSLINAEQALVAKVNELQTERVQIAAALPSKEEVLSNIDRLVDAEAERFAREKAGAFATALGGGADYDGTREVPRKPRLPRWGEIGSPLSFQDWCGLDPAAAKAALRRVASKAPFGPSREEKAKRLAEIDQAIQTAEQERTELLQAMSDLGLETPAVIAFRNRGRTGTPGIVGAVGFGATPGSIG